MISRPHRSVGSPVVVVLVVCVEVSAGGINLVDMHPSPSVPSECAWRTELTQLVCLHFKRRVSSVMRHLGSISVIESHPAL